MMTCSEVWQNLGVFLRGQLSAEARLDLHRHLAVCLTCAQRVEAARDAMAISRSACAAARDPVPDDVPEALLVAIHFSSRPPRL